MDQQEIWNEKWKNITKQLPATEFAKKSFDFLKDKKLNTILEIGCGDGKDSIYFAEKGFQVTALDFSKEALLQLENRYNNKSNNINTKVEDIRNIDFPENSFDVIYSNLSLHYFSNNDTIKIFSKLYRILKQDGYLFVRGKSTEDDLCSKGKKIEDNLYLVGNKEYNFFEENNLKIFLQKFEIINIEKTSSKMLTMDRGVVKSDFIETIAKKK